MSGEKALPFHGHGNGCAGVILRSLLFRNLGSVYDLRGLAYRVAFDLLMSNLSFLGGFITTIIFYATFRSGEVSSSWVRQLLLSGWLLNVPLLTATAFLASVVSGMYRSGPRSTIGHTVAISIASVGLTCLLFIGLICLINPVPRSVLPVSAAVGWLTFALLLVPGPRVAKKLFSTAYIVEPRLGLRAQKVEYVLIIGGAGYIGSVLARRLVQKGYRVRILDQLMFGDESIHALRADPHFELIRGDFRDLEAIARAIRGMDAVIHLGAIVGDPACALDQDVTLSVNTHAARMIAALCCGFGVRRFLFASTCSVYGAQAELINEFSPLAPVSLYAQSKIDAEQAILEEKQEGFHPTVLRLATAFGLSWRMRFDLVVNLLTAQALSTGKITIFNGHQWRPFIHIQDIARAFVACLEAPIEQVSGQVFNAGDNRHNLTLRELGEIIARVVPGTEVCQKDNSSDRRSYKVDFSKIATALKFRSQVSVEQGVEEIAAAIRAGRFSELEHVRYHNAAYMKSLSGRSRSLPADRVALAARVDKSDHNGFRPHSDLIAKPPCPEKG